MRTLLEKYLKAEYNSTDIDISYWNIDGAICFVSYYEGESDYKKTTGINIWDMLCFLNN